MTRPWTWKFDSKRDLDKFIDKFKWNSNNLDPSIIKFTRYKKIILEIFNSKNHTELDILRDRGEL